MTWLQVNENCGAMFVQAFYLTPFTNLQQFSDSCIFIGRSHWCSSTFTDVHFALLLTKNIQPEEKLF